MMWLKMLINLFIIQESVNIVDLPSEILILIISQGCISLEVSMFYFCVIYIMVDLGSISYSQNVQKNGIYHGKD